MIPPDIDQSTRKWIKELCPDLNEEELSKAVDAWMAYVELVVIQCERVTRENEKPEDS